MRAQEWAAKEKDYLARIDILELQAAEHLSLVESLRLQLSQLELEN